MENEKEYNTYVGLLKVRLQDPAPSVEKIQGVMDDLEKYKSEEKISLQQYDELITLAKAKFAIANNKAQQVNNNRESFLASEDKLDAIADAKKRYNKLGKLARLIKQRPNEDKLNEWPIERIQDLYAKRGK